MERESERGASPAPPDKQESAGSLRCLQWVMRAFTPSPGNVCSCGTSRSFPVPSTAAPARAHLTILQGRPDLNAETQRTRRSAEWEQAIGADSRVTFTRIPLRNSASSASSAFESALRFPLHRLAGLESASQCLLHPGQTMQETELRPRRHLIVTFHGRNLVILVTLPSR